MQQLIQPVNNMIVSASFKNTAYANKFGFEHWGFDCYGNYTVYAQGKGEIISRGNDKMYGKYICILYKDCVIDLATTKDVLANYFHFDSIFDGGPTVNKDTRIGVMGKTGLYANGVHLHTEMRVVSQNNMLKRVSPFKSEYFIRDRSSHWINPLDITACKETPPDSQRRTFADHVYTNYEDRSCIIYV